MVARLSALLVALFLLSWAGVSSGQLLLLLALMVLGACFRSPAWREHAAGVLDRAWDVVAGHRPLLPCACRCSAPPAADWPYPFCPCCLARSRLLWYFGIHLVVVFWGVVGLKAASLLQLAGLWAIADYVRFCQPKQRRAAVWTLRQAWVCLVALLKQWRYQFLRSPGLGLVELALHASVDALWIRAFEAAGWGSKPSALDRIMLYSPLPPPVWGGCQTLRDRTRAVVGLGTWLLTKAALLLAGTAAVLFWAILLLVATFAKWALGEVLPGGPGCCPILPVENWWYWEWARGQWSSRWFRLLEMCRFLRNVLRHVRAVRTREHGRQRVVLALTEMVHVLFEMACAPLPTPSARSEPPLPPAPAHAVPGWPRLDPLRLEIDQVTERCARMKHCPARRPSPQGGKRPPTLPKKR